MSSSVQVKSQQADVMRILESKSIRYELIDISVGRELCDEMRSKAGNPAAVPPQLFNEDQYCGVRGAHTHTHTHTHTHLRAAPGGASRHGIGASVGPPKINVHETQRRHRWI